MVRMPKVGRVFAAALGLVLYCESQFVSSTYAQQQPQNQDDPLVSSSDAMRRHIRAQIKRLPEFEPKTSQVLEQARKDAKAGNDAGLEAPKKHPWLENPSGANPESEVDYAIDSLVATHAVLYDRTSPLLRQGWSCFEPKLIATGTAYPLKIEAMPPSKPLADACAMACFDAPYFIPGVIQFPPFGPIGNPLKPPFRIDDIYTPFLDDEFEVIEYWWPEHQVAINNYGTSRLNPAEQPDPKGGQFTRQALLAQKRGVPESGIKQQIKQSYPFEEDLDSSPLERIRKDPRIGQGMWSGISATDTQDKFYAHGYRTRIGYQTANDRPDNILGWSREPKSIYDSFPPRTSQKAILNLWTEHEKADVLTSVAQVSYDIPGRVGSGMQALYGPKRKMREAALEDPAFFRNTGAVPFRTSRWNIEYGDLNDAMKVDPNGSAALREVVFRGGHELLPLVTNSSGFGSPYSASTPIFARRAFYLMGAPPVMRFLGLPERDRMNEYTVNGLDKGLEVDKMSWLGRPLFESKGVSMHNVIMSECFRSQKIPNSADQTKYPWYGQNLPSNSLNYVNQDLNDSAFIYWNKRVACTCKQFGLPHGAFVMDFPVDEFGAGRGSGDRPYGKPEVPLCWYREGNLPQAFGGKPEDRCQIGEIGGPAIYFGINDAW